MIRAMVAALASTICASAFAADGGRPSKVVVDPTLAACLQVTAAELEPHLGAPVRIRETNAGTKGSGGCIWEGKTKGAVVHVMHFPGDSIGVPAGQERAYFDQIMAARGAQNKPGEFTPVAGLGEAAWKLDLADNAPNYFAVYVFGHGNMTTITSNGLGPAPTLAIARSAAARM